MRHTRRMISFFCLLCLLFSTVARADETATGPRSLPAIKTQAEFDELARINTDTGYALPHVLFVIDRRDHDKIYYVNSKRYRFHKDFVNGTYLSLERGQEFFENNYLKPNRRFIMGTLAYQTPVKRFAFEFWEGDTVSTDMIKLAADVIKQTIFAPVAFKPNSSRQDEASASIAGLERVTQSDIAKEQEYLPLNLAHGLGRIHIIPKLDEHVEIGFNEILVLDEVPVNLPAKSWGVPNAYIKNANELFKLYDGWWVSFDTKLGNYEIKRANLDQLKEYQARLYERHDLIQPRANLEDTHIASPAQQRGRR